MAPSCLLVSRGRNGSAIRKSNGFQSPEKGFIHAGAVCPPQRVPIRASSGPLGTLPPAPSEVQFALRASRQQV